MKPLVAITALAVLTGCAVVPPRPGYPPIAYRHLPNAWRYVQPVYPVPQATFAPGAPPPVSQLQPNYNTPYTPEQMTTGVAEATGLAALLTGGQWTPPTPGGGGGRPGPVISPDADRPEPYNCAWGFSSTATCVGPLR